MDNILDSEKTVLGSILYNEGSFQRLEPYLRDGSDFIHSENRAIYKSMQNLDEQGEMINLLTVETELTKLGLSSEVGRVYLSELVSDYAVGTSDAISIAKQIVQRASERMLETRLDIIHRQVQEKMNTLPEYLTMLELLIVDIGKKHTTGTTYTGKELINAFYEFTKNHDNAGVLTGVEQIDKDVHNFFGGELIIIAARPGAGKSIPDSYEVITPYGNVTHGSLKVGDKVISRDGRPTTVTGVFPQGERPIYYISFEDGTEAMCDGEHLWSTDKGVVTCNEMKDTLESVSYSIPICDSVELRDVMVSVDENYLSNYPLEEIGYVEHYIFSLPSLFRRKVLKKFISSSSGAFSTRKESVADSLANLARSLGIFAAKEKKGNIFTITTDITKKYKKITGISYSHDEHATCIMVDNEEHLYLLKDYVVTHNTTMLLQGALSNLNEGKKVGFITMEMSPAQLLHRMISAHSKVDGVKVNAFDVDHMSEEGYYEEWLPVVKSLEYFEKAPLYIDTAAPYNASTVMSSIRKLKYEYDIDMLYLDYIQLIEGDNSNSFSNRNMEITTISRKLKNLAMELDIPIVVAAQLNRSVEGRVGQRPILSDLRESGSLEQDASMVCFLYADSALIGAAESEEMKTKIRNSAEMPIMFDIAKARSGPLGTYKLTFNKPTSSMVLSNKTIGGFPSSTSYDEDDF